MRKENKQLKMEVDILKQAALILGRKSEGFVKTVGNTVSRRRIGRCMAKYGLVSNYTKKVQRKEQH